MFSTPVVVVHLATGETHIIEATSWEEASTLADQANYTHRVVRAFPATI